MFGELRESHPSGGVHVKVVLVLDEFLVDLIDAHAFRVISNGITNKGPDVGIRFEQGYAPST